MDKKQKEALIIALAEKGATYREITKKAGVSPNTIKAVLNRAGLDESASISSRAFELFAEGKTPLQVTITLNLEAEVAIQYHQQYFMLLGCTEFTKVYLQVKDNPWPYVNLAKLVQNSRMGDSEVVELLRISNGYLPRVRLEYGRINEEMNSTKAELNSWKAAVSNEVRVYQNFCDRNLTLKNREDELQLSISELEDKQTKLNESLSEFQYNINLDPDVEQDDITLTNDVLIPPRVAINYPPQVELSSRTLIFDTN
jgi:predicted transcriptional regulator